MQRSDNVCDDDAKGKIKNKNRTKREKPTHAEGHNHDHWNRSVFNVCQSMPERVPHSMRREISKTPIHYPTPQTYPKLQISPSGPAGIHMLPTLSLVEYKFYTTATPGLVQLLNDSRGGPIIRSMGWRWHCR